MKSDMIAAISERAEEFGRIASKVNEASKKRLEHLDTIATIAGQCGDLCGSISAEIELFSDGGLEQRDKNLFILNTCAIVGATLSKQKEIFAMLFTKQPVPVMIADEIRSVIEQTLEDLGEAGEYARKIIDLDNRIILMNNLLIHRKRYQGKAVQNLARLIEAIRVDSERAVRGSDENSARGVALSRGLSEIAGLIKKNDRAGIEELMKEARTGWQTASQVNVSSKSQFEFAEKVHRFTSDIHGEASSIRNMIAEKHNLFEESVQALTVLTVIIALKLKEYLRIKELVYSIEYNEQTRPHLNELAPCIDVACEFITDLAAVNIDMTGSSRRINEIDAKIVTTTKREMWFCEEIWREMESMMEVARYPVEGSEMNIVNGRFLESKLEEIVGAM